VESVKLAAEVGARRVVLTHFSQRYRTLDAFLEEASAHHPDVVIARDCERISMPSPRR
jgi:ribonuclease Z